MNIIGRWPIRPRWSKRAYANDLPWSSNRFELAMVQKRTTSASYPNVIMRARVKSSRRRAPGQKVPLQWVHVFSRLPVSPWTKTILELHVSTKWMRMPCEAAYSTTASEGSATILIPVGPSVEYLYGHWHWTEVSEIAHSSLSGRPISRPAPPSASEAILCISFLIADIVRMAARRIEFLRQAH